MKKEKEVLRREGEERTYDVKVGKDESKKKN